MDSICPQSKTLGAHFCVCCAYWQKPPPPQSINCSGEALWANPGLMAPLPKYLCSRKTQESLSSSALTTKQRLFVHQAIPPPIHPCNKARPLFSEKVGGGGWGHWGFECNSITSLRAREPHTRGYAVRVREWEFAGVRPSPSTGLHRPVRPVDVWLQQVNGFSGYPFPRTAPGIHVFRHKAPEGYISP